MSGALREAVAVVLTALLPVVLVAAVAAVVAGLLSNRLGLRDGALVQIARAVAVIAALIVLGEGLAAAVLEFGVHTWSTLGAPEPP